MAACLNLTSLRVSIASGSKRDMSYVTCKGLLNQRSCIH